jgi:type IV pilus assembly protein PilY1
LSTPAASDAAKPNILFIIDSSGSMTTVEKSQEPYDGTKNYSGPCNTSMYYWSTNNSIPNCGNRYRFYKSVFHCEQGVDQARNAGSYTDKMSMYYKVSGKSKWREPYRTLANSAVECQSDAGVHGSNSNPTGAPYARRGTNKSAFTNNSRRQLNWGSSSTNDIITVFDSNYLNWYHNPPGSNMRRTDIVKSVTKNVLSSINNVNVGFMRFHYDAGGPVIHAVKDLDDNRSEADDVVDSIPASGWTPLSETLYEAARYWSGLSGVYGGTTSTDSDALVSSSPMVYDNPAEYACSKNFIVLLTDGEPTKDRGAYSRVPSLPDYEEATGRTYCTGGDKDGSCLDDISEYLSKVDINKDVPGQQSVTTYTIGFTVDLPILKSTAQLSGGEYYLASDVKSLTAALTDIVTDIFDRDISFTAPAVAVNTFNRTQNLNDLYVSVFRATDEVHWPGNIKKYQLKEGEIRDANDVNAVDPNTGFFADSARNFWLEGANPDGANVAKGGVANELPHPDQRKMYTNNFDGDLTQAGNELSVGNAPQHSLDDFGLTGAADEPSIVELINFSRGLDVQDEDNDPDTTTRNAMGDTLHSQPATVVYGDQSGGQTPVLFSATNDGYLHAFNADTGEEKWSFIPRTLLPNLKDLYFNRNIDYKNYGLDGDVVPIVADLNEDGVIEVGTDFVYIVFGMRRGGDRYYMLDVTDPDRPFLKWIKTFPEFGQTWSAPAVVKVKIDSASVRSAQDAVLVMGAGYDTTHDTASHPDSPDLEGAGIFMLDLETGDPLWRAGPDAFANLTLDKMTRSIPSRIRVIDFSGDGYADRMYASDLGGQIWRFDVKNGEIPNKLVAGGVIAQFGAEGLSSPGESDTRRFYTTPDVAMFEDKKQQRRYLSVSIGTGYRAHPLDNSASDRFYSLRDANVFDSLSQAQYNAYPIATDGDLVDVSGKYDTVIPSSGRGWKLVLPPQQKVLSDSRTFDDLIYFVTMQPEIDSSDPCRAGLSTNRLYRVNVNNGDPVWGSEMPLPPSESAPEVIDDARVINLEQSGIAPAPIFLFPSHWNKDCVGSECKTRPMACVGVECFDPDFDNIPVRTLWTQDGID